MRSSSNSHATTPVNGVGVSAELLTFVNAIIPILEQNKMYTTNKESVESVESVEAAATTPEIGTNVPWVLHLPSEESLPKRSTVYAAGDFWVPFEGLCFSGNGLVAETKERVMLGHWLRFGNLLPGYTSSLGRYLTGFDTRNYQEGPLYHVDIFGELATQLSDTVIYEGIRQRLGSSYYGTPYNYEDAEQVARDVQELTGYKVHKQALELYKEHLKAHAYTAQERQDAYKLGAIGLMMQMHGAVVTRYAVPVGIGFRNGEPLFIIATPRCPKDLNAVTEYHCSEMRVGKLLAAYFGTAIDYRRIIEDMKVLNVEPKTYLCKTEQEWYDAYKHGPDSCMTDFAFDRSPVRCYATTSHDLPDNGLRLFISYIGELFGDNFKVQARAIVNEECKTYVRAYGKAADAILRAAGYGLDYYCLDGALLARIEHPCRTDAVLMPYLDGNSDHVEKHSDNSFIIDRCGDLEAQDSDGYIYVQGRYECSDCGEHFHEDDVQYTAGGEPICPDCAGFYVTPIGRDALYPECNCSWSDYHGEWVHDDDAAECAISGVVHDSETLVSAQGYTVLEEHTYEHDVHGYILTEEAARHLDEPFLGLDEEEEEAA